MRPITFWSLAVCLVCGGVMRWFPQWKGLAFVIFIPFIFIFFMTLMASKRR